MIVFRWRPLATAAAAVALLAGCQSYTPQPIDPEAHAAQWRSRAPDAPGVVAFADRLAAGNGRVTTYDPADGLTLPEAEIVALFFNPRLRELRAAVQVPLASATGGSRWADPQLGVDGEFILDNADDPLVIGGGLELTIPLSGRPGAEQRLDLAEATAAQRAVAVGERDMLLALRGAWIAWSTTREQADRIAAYLQRIDAVASVATLIQAAGELRRVDSRLFELERARQEGRIAQLRATQEEQRLAIVALLGLVPDAPVQLLPALDAALSDTPAAERAERLREANAELAARLSDHDVTEHAVDVEIRKQYPDLSIGLGYANDQGQSRLTFGLGLPIPSINLNRRGIAVARARREGTRVAWEAAMERLAHELAATEVRHRAARDRLDYLTGTLAPLIDTQVADARELAELGEFDALLQLDAIRQQHETQLELLAARATVSLTRIELEALAGWLPQPAPDEETGP